MPRGTTPAGRSAFTLVELLVAMGILITLTALALLVVPSAMDQDRTTDGATLVRQWLMIAKSRATRDQLPRGVRLIVDGNKPAGQQLFVTELQYTEVPPLLVGSTMPNEPVMNTSGPTPVAGPPNAQPSVLFSYQVQTPPAPMHGPPVGTITAQQCVLQNVPPNIALQLNSVSASQSAVLYLPTVSNWTQIPDSGFTARITNYAATSPTSGVLTLASASLSNVFYPDNANGELTNSIGAATQLGVYGAFGIYLTPQPLVGEPTQQLPKNICIDLGQYQPAWTSTTTDFDIVFGPNGQVLPLLSSSGGTTQVNLWVRDFTKGGVNPAQSLAWFQQGGEQQIVSLKANTGSLGVFPVMWPPYATGQSAFTFAQMGATGYGQ